MSSVTVGCESRPCDLAGQIKWVDVNTTGGTKEGPLGKVFGAAFLLLEGQYKSIGYEGPPDGYPKTREEAVEWNQQMPNEWWNYSSMPYEWWGRGSEKEPTEVTLSLAAPVHLLRAHLDSNGSFEFKDLPRGRHTLFIRWGQNPDPQDNVSGPFAVVIEKRGRIDQVIPVSAFDMIST